MSFDRSQLRHAFGAAHPSRRDILAAATATGLLTPLATLLARRAEAAKFSSEPAQSLIVLWLAGGPSQLETFDPHPGRRIAAETRAIETNVTGIQFAAGLSKLAQRMNSLAVIRSLQSKEGDHERGTYLVKTGYAPILLLFTRQSAPSAAMNCPRQAPISRDTFRSCPVSGLPEVGIWATSTIPSRPAIRPAGLQMSRRRYLSRDTSSG